MAEPNFFAQFDEPAAALVPTGRNFFAQFDEPGTEPPGEKPGMLTSAARGATQGLTLGLADESYGAMQGVKGLMTGEGFGVGYERGRDEYRARDRVAKDANPITSMVSEAGGSVLPVVAGGMTTLGAKALGLTGETLLGRTAMSTGSGATIGGVQGFNQGQGGFNERAGAAGPAVATGAVVGAASPVIGRATGSLYAWVRNQLGQRGAAIANPAADALEQNFRAAGGPQAVRQRMQELGPDAMLLDASPGFTGRAQGLAVLPETRDAVMTPVIERQAGANRRMMSDVDAAVGPAPIPSRVEAGLAEGRQAVGDLYGPVFQDARAVNTQGLADALDTMLVDLRGPAREGALRARTYLNIPGTRELDPSPRAMFETRQALDGLMEGETNSKVLRTLGFARQAVDDYLTRAVPGIKQADAQFQELSRQSRGLTAGQKLLNSGPEGVRPAELADDLTRAINPDGTLVGPSGEAFQMKQGLRADIDRQIGTKANNLTALKNIVKGEGDWNRDKLAQVFGPDRAEQILASVDREVAFNQAYNEITKNSQTAMRAESAKGVQPRAGGEGSGSINDMGTTVAGAAGGLPGLALNIGGRAIRLTVGQVQRASDMARNQELATALTRGSGPQLDLLIRTIEDRIGFKAAGETAGQRAGELAQILTQSQGYQGSKALPDRWRLSQ